MRFLGIFITLHVHIQVDIQKHDRRVCAAIKAAKHAPNTHLHLVGVLRKADFWSDDVDVRDDARFLKRVLISRCSAWQQQQQQRRHDVTVSNVSGL